MPVVRFFFGNRAATPAAAPPSGWQRINIAKAAVPVWSALLLCTQPTSFAVPAQVANPALSGWQQQTNSAPPRLAAGQGSALTFLAVPASVSARAPDPALIMGWQQATARPLSVAFIGGSGLTFVVPPFVVPSGWQSQQTAAAPVAQARIGNTFVPFNTVQTNTTTIDKWQQPFSVRPPVATANPTQATQFQTPAQAAASNSVTQVGWFQPLSTAAPVAKAQAGLSFVPFNTTQIIPAVPKGWFGQVSLAAKVAQPQPTQTTSFAVPPQVLSNSVSQYGWYAPLSKSAPTVKAQQGNAFVPFDTVQTAPGSTAQTVPLVYDASTPRSVTVYYQAWVRPPAYLTPAETFVHWQQPLSKPVPVAQAQPGNFFVPFNTAQIIPPPPKGWYQALSAAVPVAQAAPGYSFVPLNTTQQNTVTIDKWQQPLAGAPQTARAQAGYSLAPFDTAQTNTTTIDRWQQPLSRPVAVAVALQGNAFVPLNTVQPPPAGISGMAWFAPLGMVPGVIPTAPQGTFFVPFDTAQVSQAPAVGRLIRGGGHKQYKRKKLWEEVLEVEREAEQAKRDAAKANREATTEPTKREAIRAKREAERLAAKAKEVAALIEAADLEDEEEILMLLLS